MPYTGRPDTPDYDSKLSALASMERLTDAARCQNSATTTVGIFETTEWSRCLTQNHFGLALYDGGHGVPQGYTDFILDWFEGQE